MIPFERAVDELHRSFDVPPGALERCEEILAAQYMSLAKYPPLASLPDSVRLAAATRIRSGPVMTRERVPVDSVRVAELAWGLARLLVDDPGPLASQAEEWVDAALPAATANDATGIHAAALRLGLPPEVAANLLREALKPEMLRTSTAFRGLAADAGARARCPLCGDLPCAATEAGEACCRWCGLIWPWDGRACGECRKEAWAASELTAIARHAKILRCTSCGEVMKIFRTVADPLVLSLHGILTSPFDLATRLRHDAPSREAFPVF